VRRTRLVVGAVAAAVVVAGGVAIGAALASGSSHRLARGQTHSSHPVTAAGHGHLTTTVPSGDLTPTAPTAYGATYAAPSSPYTVVVGASASCWVLATQGATGKVVWTGTVAPGQTQSLPVSGNLVVRLGAPSDAHVTMNDRPVQLPSGFRSPFDLTFAATP
jgi:hypothetical protein